MSCIILAYDIHISFKYTTDTRAHSSIYTQHTQLYIYYYIVELVFLQIINIQMFANVFTYLHKTEETLDVTQVTHLKLTRNQRINGDFGFV